MPHTVSTLQSDNFTPVSVPLDKPSSGVAPLAKLISVQVLTSAKKGNTFDCIRGLEYVRKLNQNSPDIQVDGANLSFGYDLDPATYGCGNSPICEEVDRCVNAGICVVVSCGNSGFGVVKAQAAGLVTSAPAGIAISISDPANARLSIAVGSVHKSEPHRYGISYFSSKGPTLDGRHKPDMVAPRERRSTRAGRIFRTICTARSAGRAWRRRMCQARLRPSCRCGMTSGEIQERLRRYSSTHVLT